MSTNYDPEEIAVNGLTDVYVAPVGTTFPASLDADLSDWTHLGLTAESGVKPGLNRTLFSVKSSQRFYPTRKGVASIDADIEFDLQQWNSDTLLLALGGGTIEDEGGGEWLFTPAPSSFIDERALLLVTTDGDNVTMWGWARTTNTKNFTSSFVRTAESVLPIGMSILDPGDAEPFLIRGNSAAFVATGS